MAFISSDLNVLAYANNFALWHYVSTEDDVREHGYFNNAADMFGVNDLIIVNNVDGTHFLVVTKSDDGVVVVSTLK